MFVMGSLPEVVPQKLTIVISCTVFLVDCPLYYFQYPDRAEGGDVLEGGLYLTG